jgi:hypothetical protein
MLWIGRSTRTLISGFANRLRAAPRLSATYLTCAVPGIAHVAAGYSIVITERPATCVSDAVSAPSRRAARAARSPIPSRGGRRPVSSPRHIEPGVLKVVLPGPQTGEVQPLPAARGPDLSGLRPPRNLQLVLGRESPAGGLQHHFASTSSGRRSMARRSSRYAALPALGPPSIGGRVISVPRAQSGWERPHPDMRSPLHLTAHR